MKQYLSLLTDILENGTESSDRTGVGTKKVFGRQLRFNLQDGFPAVTTKQLYFKGVVEELKWFISGSTNNDELVKRGCRIWTANYEHQGKALGYTDGELGKIYGYNWRNLSDTLYGPEDSLEMQIADKVGYVTLDTIWRGQEDGKPFVVKRRVYDQLEDVLKQIREEPDSRRIILQSWIPQSIPFATLPACHAMAQFQVENGKLHCMMTQRSCDVFLGLPFNIASYALLTHILANMAKLQVGELIISIGDAHVYLSHLDQVNVQLARTPHALPELFMSKQNLQTFEEVEKTKFNLVNYLAHPTIKADMAV